MIHYVVVAGPSDAVARARPRLRSALRDTSYMAGTELDAVDPDGCWAVAAVECADPLVSERLVARDGAFTVFNGSATAAHGTQQELSERTFRAFTLGGVSAAGKQLRGMYNFVGGSPTRGVEATTDFSALNPMYWGEGEVAVFSNRSSTVRAVLGEGGWNVGSMAWLLSLSLLMGEEMPARGVRYLLPHQVARVAPGEARVKIEESRSVWPDPTLPLRDNLTPAEWDLVTDDLVRGCRSLGSLDHRLRLNLTGGKDSRLVLALFKAAGLEDNVFTVTHGLPDNPEVEVAAEVARVAGYEHRRHGPPAPKPTDEQRVPASPDFAVIWRRLAQAAYRFDAMVCPWDGLSPLAPLRSTNLEVKGFAGEYYKGPEGADPQFRKGIPSTAAEMAEKLVNFKQAFDPLSILHPEVADRQKDWIRGWTMRTAETLHLDLIPMRMYFDYRMPSWSGPMAQYTPGRININPLASAFTLAKVFECSAEVTNSGRFHYEIMKRAAPELVTVPFLGDTWSEQVAATSEFDLPRKPFPTTVELTPQVLTSWKWEFMASQESAMDELFAEAASTELAEVCDVAKLRKAARRAGELKKTSEVKALLSGICLSLTLLGRTEPVLDEPLSPPRSSPR